MKASVFVGALLALLVLAGLPAAEKPASAAPPGFVTASGDDLMLDGQPYVFSGLNIYNANSDGWCWYQMNEGPELDDALTDIGPGKTVMRAWFNQPLAIDKNSGLRDWSGFDHTLAVAEAHGVKVIVTLGGQWGECGDGGANGYRDTTWYTTGYTQVDPTMLVSFRDWVAEVVDRYKNSPTVAFWQLMNEAEVKDSIGSGCPDGTGPRDVLAAWAADVGGLVKSIDPDHLVSLGTIGSGQCGTANADYAYVHALPEIDLCEYHDYWDPAPIPGDQWNGLQVRIDQCDALDKPLFIGEVGVRPNDVGGTLQGRADVLRAKIAAQRTEGVDGFLAWNWSNLGSTYDNFDIGPDDPTLEALILDDNCPAWTNPQQNLPPWPVSAPDPDCDGFATADEARLETDPEGQCAATAATNDETDDRWPVDFNDSQFANTLDLVVYVTALNTSTGHPQYVARADLNGSGSINTLDLVAYATMLNKGCTT
jgi:hypothetical protein